MRLGSASWVVVWMLASCSDDTMTDPDLIDGLFTEAEWAKVQKFTPLGPPPASPSNRYADNQGVAELGQKLFFEKRYAGALIVGDDGTNGELGQTGETGKVACVTCHNTTHYFSDGRANNKLSRGAAVPKRNTPSLVNVVYYEWGNWAGAHPTFWKQGANGAESKDNFNGNRLSYVHLIYDKYRFDYDLLFPIPLDPALDPMHPEAARFPPSGKPKSTGAPDGPWEGMTPDDQLAVNTVMANCGKAYEAYERLLISRNAPFDHYVAGDFSALGPSAKRGLKLFIGKAACDACHADTTFTDNKFHNTGVMQAIDPQDQGHHEDLPKALSNTFNPDRQFSDDPAWGAMKLAGLAPLSEEHRGQFRTKSLRHVEQTAPYFHDGSMPTLEAVVRFYNDGGGATGFPGSKDPLLVPLNLTDQEVLDLVAFLESLTGEPIPAHLMIDTSAP